MTQLEENNIKTQLSLLNDYINDESLIHHYISTKAHELLNNFQQDFKNSYVDKFRGRIDSVLLFKLEKFIYKYINLAFDWVRK